MKSHFSFRHNRGAVSSPSNPGAESSGLGRRVGLAGLWLVLALAGSARGGEPDLTTLHENVDTLATLLGDGIAKEFRAARHVLFTIVEDGYVPTRHADLAMVFFTLGGIGGSNGYSTFLAVFRQVDSAPNPNRTPRPWRLVAVTRAAGKGFRDLRLDEAFIRGATVEVPGKMYDKGMGTSRLPIVSTFRLEDERIVDETRELVGYGRDDRTYFENPDHAWIQPLEDAILATCRIRYPELRKQIDALEADRYQHNGHSFSIGYHALDEALADPDLWDWYQGPDFGYGTEGATGASRMYTKDGRIQYIRIEGKQEWLPDNPMPCSLVSTLVGASGVELDDPAAETEAESATSARKE